MTNGIAARLHMAGQATRFAWYYALNRLVDRASGPRPAASAPRSRLPTPSTRELLADLAALFARDAAAVGDGIYSVDVSEPGLVEALLRAREMLSDVPQAAARRKARDATTSRNVAGASAMPDYYAQDFHFQSGGYLTDQSARLYDVQVETLFLGGAAAMRRETLRPIADFMRGRDQRNVELLDVACGTGRLLREVRLNWPGMRLTGVDLSHPYLDEGRRHFGGLRPSTWIAAAAECLPLPGNSVRIATTTYLFHELPADVRRKVTGEIVRVLRPGGLFVFLDSLQLGDRPDWDGVLENFPSRFHEPFYRQYLREDLAALFREAGLQVESSWASYLSKVMVCRKPA